MRYIREQIFRCDTQEQFAELLGISQSRVSSIETGKAPFNRRCQEKILQVAAKRRMRFNVRLFFEVPPSRKARGG